MDIDIIEKLNDWTLFTYKKISELFSTKAEICRTRKINALCLTFRVPVPKAVEFITSGVYPSTFVDSHFPPIIQFLYCLLISVAPWGGPVVDSKGKMFEMYVCRLPENAFFSDFSGNLRVYTYIQVSFMHVCDDPNQRVRKIAQ